MSDEKNKALSNEVNEFLDDIPTPPVGDTPPEPPPSEAPPAEPPVAPPATPPATPPGEEPPPVPPVTPPVEPPVPPVEPPPTEPPQPPPTMSAAEYEATISSLRTQLEEFAKKVMTPPQPPPPAAEPPKVGADGKPLPPTAPEPIPLQPFQFIKNETEFDEILRSSENFNKLLTGVLYKSVETMMRTVPKLITNLADQQFTTRTAITEFYQKNEDLIQSRAYVGMVADELAAQHPDWTLDKLMGELGGEVRTRLKMVSGTKPSTPPEKKPSFAGTGGGGGNRQTVPQVKTLQDEVNDLISDN